MMMLSAGSRAVAMSLGQRSRPEPHPRVRGDEGGRCTSPASPVIPFAWVHRACYSTHSRIAILHR
jgi:hypothetical protein